MQFFLQRRLDLAKHRLYNNYMNIDYDYLLRKACAKYKEDNQAILNEVLSALPHEPWDDIAVNDPQASNKTVREEFRYKSKKWEFARHYIHHLQNDICAICNKPLNNRFDLHHKDKGRGHYFELKLTNLEAVHHECHMNKQHGGDIKNALKNNMSKKPTSLKKKKKRSDIKNALKNNMPKTGENEMIEATKFAQVIRGIKPVTLDEVLNTTEMEQTWKNHPTVNRGFIATSISILINQGLLVRVNRGEHRVTKDFLYFLQCTDKQIEGLFRANKKASAPYGDLHMQDKKNQTMCFDRIRHPYMQQYLVSIGLDVDSLMKNSADFRDMKLKNYLSKKAQLYKAVSVPKQPPPDGISGLCKSEPPKPSSGGTDYRSYLDSRVKALLDEKAKSIVAKIA